MNTSVKSLVLILLPLLLCLGQACRSLPKEKVAPFDVLVSHRLASDSLLVSARNGLKCPILLSYRTEDKGVDSLLKDDFPLLMSNKGDTLLYYPFTEEEQKPEIYYNFSLGDPGQVALDTNLVLPFPRGKSYKIIQGYNGKYSHNSAFSRYAIDFSLAVGDTVCAAADGWVINAIEAYIYGGSSRKWRPYANYITLYHPDKQIYTQYVHLKHEGSLVEAGEAVKAGQAIGLSGKTGFTDVAHLHFNVLKSSGSGLISTQASFVEGYEGGEFKKGMKVKK